MGIVRDLYYARKMSAGLKLPAPTVALLIKRLRLAAAMGGGIEKTVIGTMVHITDALAKAALSVLVSIEPIQDLHGYDNPWIGTDYDQQPYNFRAVSSSSISPLGNSEMGNIVGGTVGWNQVCVNPNFNNNPYGFNGTTSNANNICSLTPSGSKSSTLSYGISFSIGTIIANHKYAYWANFRSTKADKFRIRFGNYTKSSDNLSANTWGYISGIFSTDDNLDVHTIYAYDDTLYTTSDRLDFKQFACFDLTKMFGSTIADYLYTLESGTAGAGVAKLKSWGFCTKPYYAYDAGSLQSVNTSAHKTYKADTTLLGNYALDSSLTLRGIPKLDANNNLYYDGDSYEASGTVTRKYGIVDLGTLTYTKNTGAWRATISGRKYAGSGGGYIGSIIVGYAYDFKLRSDMTYAFSTSNNGYVWFRNDTYTTADAFKTAMTGHYLIYALATPTTETATAYAATQSIDPDGTEEYVDYAESQGARDVAIPVGHYTNYANICPISGRTGLSVYVSPTQDVADATTYAVDWTTEAGTVYGGTLDVVTGVLTVDRVNIPSYNGETINEPWVSSMDAYAEGATPTIGAQVVYTLATPLTYQLTAQEVQMLLGENNIWASSGDTVSVTYYAEGNANPLQSLNILLGGNYSNPKTADDVSDKEALEIILGGNK